MSPSGQNTQVVSVVDAKEHYESLISLFKSHFNKTIIYTSFVIAAAVYLTSGNVKDIREEMRESIKTQVELIKGDVKEEAGEQAAAKIVEIFQKENLDKYITKEIENSIEPKIKDLIQNQINLRAADLIEQAMADIQSSEPMTKLAGTSFLVTAPYFSLSGQHIEKLIFIARNKNTDPTTKANIAGVLVGRPSEATTQFFREELLGIDSLVQDFALRYLVKPEINQDLELYGKFTKNNPQRLIRLKSIASQLNPNLLKELEKMPTKKVGKDRTSKL